MDYLLGTDPRIIALSQQRLRTVNLTDASERDQRVFEKAFLGPERDERQQGGSGYWKRDEGQLGSKRETKPFSKSASDYFVSSLPGLPDLASHPTHPLNVFAGKIPSYPGAGVDSANGPTGVDANIFFMMIRARRSAGAQRLVFWFNGGPGCSSFDGSLMEVGPFRTVPASKTQSGKVELELVEGGWEEFATIVFIDQPPGTGLSTVPSNGFLHELDQASAHLIKFLEGFYQVFPELKTLDTYLAGESFAGQYIPYFADAIMKTDKVAVPLKGISIGNGWIDPRTQYQGYVDFAYKRGLIKPDTKESQALEAQMKNCQKEVDKWAAGSAMPINFNGCGGVMGAVTNPFVQEMNGKKMCMNVYDVRLFDDWPACGMNWPPDLPDIYQYLRRDDVLKALHADDRSTAWVECSNAVSSQLWLRNSPASVNLLSGIIAGGVKIMMFAGDEDLICNYAGIERMLENLEWQGETGLGNATAEEWYVNGTYAGTWQTARDMTYVRIAGGSHMVGFDLPHVTNDLIIRFMGVDMSELLGSTSVYPSKLGGEERPQMAVLEDTATKSPSLGSKIDLDTYASAGSAFFVVLFLAAAAGLYFYLRSRSRYRRAKAALQQLSRRDEEESVPLGPETHELDDYDDGLNGNGNGSGKGKGKMRVSGDEDPNVVFELGDEE